MTTTTITGVRAISIPVTDQDKALDFYVGTLGFDTVRDVPVPGGGRWIELSPGGGTTVVTLEPNNGHPTRGDILIRFSASDAEAAHTSLRAAGVDTDEVLRWPGTPPMFAFRDPDGNAFSITEAA
jgi:lactoylglutathione lyase